MIRIFNWIKVLIYSFIGYFLITPIVFFYSWWSKAKKDNPKYILFIGRDDGRFIDNVKYLYLYFCKKRGDLRSMGYEICFLTENQEVLEVLEKNKLPVVRYFSPRAIQVLANTHLLIIDNGMWIKRFKLFFLKNTKKIQLWHGVGFKYINKMLPVSLKSEIRNFLIGGRDPQKCYSVISTSPFYTRNVFSKAFETCTIWETGYPRNDLFFRNIRDEDLIFADVELIKKVDKIKSKGYKVVLYAPTLRETGGDPIRDGALDSGVLTNFLISRKIVMVIKFHPDPDFEHAVFSQRNILFYDYEKDVYPLLRCVDCLVTDYSSIYMDFLLIDKPIIFFPYDLDKYITKDRKIQFDYSWITPGVKVYSQEELHRELERILLRGYDDFRDKRKEIRKMAFKHVDGSSCDRIYKKVLSLIEQ